MVQQRSEETRGKILSAAEKLFAQEGYDATGVAEICDQAGVSKGAFYHHFDSKQAVFLTLLDQWLERLDAEMQHIRASSQDGIQALVEITALTGAVFSDAEGRLPIFLEFWTKAIHDPDVWQTVPEQFSRYRRFISDLLCQGLEPSCLSEADTNKAARMVMALAVGMLVQGLVEPDETDWGAALQDGIGVMLRGLEEKSAG